MNNKLPTVTTDPNTLEEQARKHMGARSFNYIAGGAGEKATMDANRLAFRQWKVCPVIHQLPAVLACALPWLASNKAHFTVLSLLTQSTDDPTYAPTNHPSRPAR